MENRTYYSYMVRPSGLFDKGKPFSVYGTFDVNRAERLFSGTKEECYRKLEQIRNKAANDEDRIKSLLDDLKIELQEAY